MRYVVAALVCAAALIGGARAEKRTFIVANNSDGYGVDRCLATGAACGMAVATAYCQARDFAQVTSFRRVDYAELGVITSADAASSRGEFVAIECLR